MVRGEQNGGHLIMQVFFKSRLRGTGDGGGGELFAEGGAADEESLTWCSASKTVVV